MTKFRKLVCAVAAAALAASFAPAAYGGGDPPPPPSGPSCDTKQGTVFLDEDPANVDDGDRKVTFCHATSSATNPFVVITTSINACRAHESHRKLPKGGERDVFPTGGCQD